jgi:hypothetical protein
MELRAICCKFPCNAILGNFLVAGGFLKLAIPTERFAIAFRIFGYALAFINCTKSSEIIKEESKFIPL